jgi:hypothetical protein
MGRCRRRSRLAAEAVFEQLLRPGCHVSGPALAGAEPGRWPRSVFDRAKMAAHVIEDCRYLFLRQLLDQAEQLLTLRAHDLSVRRVTIGMPVRHTR